MTTNDQTITEATLIEVDGSIRQLLQDNMADLLKNVPGWDKLSEQEQRIQFSKLDQITKLVVTRMLDELATEGRKSIRVSIGEVKIGKTLKIAVSAPRNLENVHDISALPDTDAYLIPVDEIGHLARSMPAAEPDQPELLDADAGEATAEGEAGAEEDEAEGAEAAGEEAAEGNEATAGVGTTAEFDPGKETPASDAPANGGSF